MCIVQLKLNKTEIKTALNWNHSKSITRLLIEGRESISDPSNFTGNSAKQL